MVGHVLTLWVAVIAGLVNMAMALQDWLGRNVNNEYAGIDTPQPGDKGAAIDAAIDAEIAELEALFNE